MDEADAHPPRDEAGLPRDHAVQKCPDGSRGPERAGVVPCRRVFGELPDRVHVAPRGEELKSADADVARRHPGQDGTGQLRFAQDGLARQQGREGAGRRDAEGRHGLADEVLAQHRS